MHIKESVEFRVDACRSNDADRIEIRAEYSDTNVKAYARSESDHAECVESRAEAGRLDILYA